VLYPPSARSARGGPRTATSPTYPGGIMSTRTIAILALVVAVIVVLILVL
jgi:hypothetical protein